MQKQTIDPKGTLLLCDCCGRETMASTDQLEGYLEIRDRRHGVNHHITLSVIDVVRLLDPQGTTMVVLGRTP